MSAGSVYPLAAPPLLRRLASSSVMIQRVILQFTPFLDTSHQYEWWIIEFELFIFAITAFLTLFPRFIPRGRAVALTFLASAFVLVMDNMNAIW